MLTAPIPISNPRRIQFSPNDRFWQPKRMVDGMPRVCVRKIIVALSIVLPICLCLAQTTPALRLEKEILLSYREGASITFPYGAL